MVKKEARILGIDDAPFNKFKDKEVLVIGTIFRGGHFLDGVISTKVDVDGTNATERLIKMIKKSKFKTQLRCLLFKGIALGGFNIINFFELHRALQIPTIVVLRKYPDFEKIFSTLKQIGMADKIELIKSFPKPEKANKIFIQYFGIDRDKALKILEVTCTHAFIPEPLRVAHLIAAGVVMGESRGRA